MKIMWFANVLFPEISKAMGKQESFFGGWTQQFKKYLSNDKEFKLIVCGFDNSITNIYEKEIDNVLYYVIPKKNLQAHLYDAGIERYVKEIFVKEQPELIHVWGTEYPHIKAIQTISTELNIKTIYSIQGIISDCAKHYVDELKLHTVVGTTFRDLLRVDNILMQKRKFEIRGNYEKEVLANAKYVIGRTLYDYSCVKEINPEINYYLCNECLRESFYKDKWNLDEAQRHTIFISQASYPIKGFHIFLEALTIVKKKYPEVKVYVAGGTNPVAYDMISRLKKGSYDRYIGKQITKRALSENVFFLGGLSENQMKEQLLRSNVFVSPSVIENSSNSVGEAMMLGVPVISSFVGGIRDMVEDGITGLLYPANQPNMMAQMIIRLFEDKNLALTISENARSKAEEIYDIRNNIDTMKLIYKDIICVK